MDDDTPPRVVKYRGEEVHVWRVWIDASTAVASLVEASLSEQEQIRAAKFRYKEDQSDTS